MDEEKRRKIRSYFSVFPQWTLAIGAVGLVIVLAGASAVAYAIGTGGILLAGAIGMRWLSNRPSEEVMDAWLQDDLRSLDPRALKKGGIDASELVQERVIVIGPRFRDLAGAFFGFRRGADERARFTPIQVTIINFTEHQLIAYQCAYDWTTGKPLNECVSEYFYNDIVSVQTQTDTYTYFLNDLSQNLLAKVPDLKDTAVNGLIQVNGGETFTLSTKAGTSVKVELNDPVLIKGLGGGELPLEWAEKAVQAVRTMLRIKKTGSPSARAH